MGLKYINKFRFKLNRNKKSLEICVYFLFVVPLVMPVFCNLPGKDSFIIIKAKSETLPLYTNFRGECACWHASMPKLTDIIINKLIFIGLYDKVLYKV